MLMVTERIPNHTFNAITIHRQADMLFTYDEANTGFLRLGRGG